MKILSFRFVPFSYFMILSSAFPFYNRHLIAFKKDFTSDSHRLFSQLYKYSGKSLCQRWKLKRSLKFNILFVSFGFHFIHLISFFLFHLWPSFYFPLFNKLISFSLISILIRFFLFRFRFCLLPLSSHSISQPSGMVSAGCWIL